MNTIKASVRPLIRSPLLRWGTVLVCVLGSALYRTVSSLLFFTALGASIPLSRIVASEAIYWVTFLPFVLFAFGVARASPFTQTYFWKPLGVHAGLSILAATILAIVVYDVSPVFFDRSSPYVQQLALMRSAGLSAYVAFGMNTVMVYWGAVGAYSALLFIRRDRERRMREVRLRGELARAELGALKATMQPHFLFNTLHAIAAHARKEQDSTVVDTLVKLGDLLRRTTDAAADEFVPLGDELALCRDFLEIARVRFGPRLKWQEKVAPTAAEVIIPSFVLQPLVENAIRHGAGNRAGDFNVDLDIRFEGERLRMMVHDSGSGLPDKFSIDTHGGVGLRTVSERLRLVYGNMAVLRIANGMDGGVEAVVDIPARHDFDGTIQDG